MKPYLNQALLIFFVLLTAAACKKEQQPGEQQPPINTVERKVYYTLYTNKDFSGNNGIITFSVFMRNNTRTLLDSALSPMKIQDIPNFANKIEIEKTVPGNDPSDLVVGFLYTIQGVGYSWYLDSCKAGQTFKVIEYPFQ